MTRTAPTPTLTPERQLRNAVLNGDLATVERLIEAGADVNHANNNGTTALIFAASNGRTEVAEKLIQAGANVNLANNDGTTALIYAAWNGRTEVVTALLNGGANADAFNIREENSVDAARKNGHTLIVGNLTQHILTHATNHPRVGPPIYQKAANGETEEICKLIRAGANYSSINATRSYSVIWLHESMHAEGEDAKKANNKLLLTLIAYGAQIDGSDPKEVVIPTAKLPEDRNKNDLLKFMLAVAIRNNFPSRANAEKQAKERALDFILHEGNSEILNSWASELAGQLTRENVVRVINTSVANVATLSESERDLLGRVTEKLTQGLSEVGAAETKRDRESSDTEEREGEKMRAEGSEQKDGEETQGAEANSGAGAAASPSSSTQPIQTTHTGAHTPAPHNPRP